MDDPKDLNSLGDSHGKIDGELDPFSELPTDTSFEGIIEETADSMDDSLDEPVADPLIESVSSARAPADGASRSRLLPRLAAVVGIVVIGTLGWLGWSYWSDREACSSIEADLLSARESSEQSKNKSEEAGEGATAQRLAVRVDEILNAEWWDRVALRMFEEDRVASAKSQSDELATGAAHRKLNRAWWVERLAAVDEALAADGRTIPSVQTARDELLIAEPPHAGEGGFSDEQFNALGDQLSSDLDQLMSDQNAQLQLRQDQLEAIRGSATLDELATRLAVAQQPAPTDRNPPEIEEALANIAAQGIVVADFLAARDAMESELSATLAEIEVLDLETGSAETMQLIATRLGALLTPEDARFDDVRELATRGAAAATAQGAILSARDGALQWFASQRTALDATTTVEELTAFALSLQSADPPASDRAIVARTAQDFLARLTTRTAVLVEERRLMDESLARAELFEAAMASVTSAVDSGQVAQAAQTLIDAVAETPEQVEMLRAQKEVFGGVAVARLNALTEDARTTGGWPAVASSLRHCLESDAIASLAGGFESVTAGLWALVSIEEDKMIYEELQRLSSGSYETFVPVARWYLDPSRTRDGAQPMHAQVLRAVEALEVPGLTVQIEGVEWSDPQCEWSQPRTSLTVAINEIPYGFDLPSVIALETTLLGTEVALQSKRDDRVEFGVSGYFDCSDDDGVFAGSGGLTMDELRSGGRFALPFWNDGDQSLAPHKLLLISIPDEEIRQAMALPTWIDPSTLIVVEGVPLEVPVEVPVEVPSTEPTPEP